MSPEMRRQLGSKGGKTAHARGTANKFTSETASIAGRRPHINGTAHKWTSEEAREAGRKGGSALRRKRAEAAAAAVKSETTH
jgi:general stress protein YciG